MVLPVFVSISFIEIPTRAILSPPSIVYSHTSTVGMRIASIPQKLTDHLAELGVGEVELPELCQVDVNGLLELGVRLDLLADVLGRRRQPGTTSS